MAFLAQKAFIHLSRLLTNDDRDSFICDRRRQETKASCLCSNVQPDEGKHTSTHWQHLKISASDHI